MASSVSFPLPLPLSSFCVGDGCSYFMKGSNHHGVIRWVGVLPKEITGDGAGGGKKGKEKPPNEIVYYAGVEFEKRVGTGNGAVKVGRGADEKKIRYFQCPTNHAAFVRLTSLSKLTEDNNNNYYYSYAGSRRRHDSSIGSSVGSYISAVSSMSLSTSTNPGDDETFESDDDDSDSISMESTRSPTGRISRPFDSLSESGDGKKGDSSGESPSSNYNVFHPIFGPATRTVQPKKSHPVLAISKCETKPKRASFSSGPSTTLDAHRSSPSSFQLPSNYKSIVCHFWQLTGKCSSGASCNFAHGNDEKRFWDERLRRGESRGGRGVGGGGGGGFFDDQDDDQDSNEVVDPRVERVKKTFRNDGQFSSKAFGKQRADVQGGGRKLSAMSK